MNRRNFLRNLGLAVAGAAVASKIELIETIVPVEAITTYNSYPTIDFKTLSETYNRLCVGSCEPDLMLVSKDLYAYMQSCIEPQYRYRDENADFDNFRFRAARITYADLDRNQNPLLQDLLMIKDPNIPIISGIRKNHIMATPHYQNFYSKFHAI